MNDKELSKLISHALRHSPEKYDLELSNDGWVSIVDLVNGIRIRTKFSNVTESDIIKSVETADKKRHEIFDGQIRALYGHSSKVEIELRNIKPPAILYHATSLSKWARIKDEGLKSMERQFVHLATSKEAAKEVALRKYQNNILLLEVNAIEAFESGISFYCNTEETIWLCKYLPPQYFN